MIVRIRLVVRVPDGLVAEDDAAVDDRGHLPIAAAEIEADTVAVQVTAERLGHRPFRRQVRVRTMASG